MCPINRYIWVLLALTLVGADAVHAQGWYADSQGPKNVYLGQALYSARQGAWVQAIGSLMASQKARQIVSEDAELLLAELYYEYGVDQEASKRVETLLNKSAAKDLRNRAWFDLSRLRYRNGHLAEAEHALGRVKGNVPGLSPGEREVFQANLYVAQGRPQDAQKLLKGLKGDPAWMWYGRYNLGTLLLKQGRKQEALALLTELGAAAGGSEDLVSLRDKANLTVGYTYLQEKQPEKARQAFEKVRLQGMYTHQALLGLGWAYLDAGAPAKALAPLQALETGHLADLPVQQGAVLLPYVLAQLGAKPEALSHYQQAVNRFEAALLQLDQAEAGVRDGRLLRSLVEVPALYQRPWQWSPRDLNDAPEHVYLTDLMASDAFQLALRNLQDLHFLDQKLSQYAKDVEIYAGALDVRWGMSQHRGPKVEVDLKAFDGVSKRRMAYDAELARIEKFSADMSLATTEEKGQLAKLDQLKNELSRLSPNEAAGFRARMRLLKGVLIWRIANEFPNRIRRVRDDMNRVDRIVNQAHRMRDSIAIARDIILTPEQRADYAQRIVQYRDVLVQLRPRIKDALAAQQTYINTTALAALAQRRQILADALSHASFAVAQLQDQGTALGKK